VLRCDELRKTFSGHRVLRGFSWQFEPGTSAIVGLNGSGKSTLLNILSGFALADSGTASWKGATITGLHPTLIARKGVARSFQDDRAAGELTVEEHVGLGVASNVGMSIFGALAAATMWRRESRERARARIDSALELLELSALAEHPVRTLSIGQRRLVALATCIATGASCFLLDEPFAGVDPSHSRLLAATLRTLASQDKTIILVEHNLARVAELAAPAVEIRDGLAQAVS